MVWVSQSKKVQTLFINLFSSYVIEIQSRILSGNGNLQSTLHKCLGNWNFKVKQRGWFYWKQVSS